MMSRRLTILVFALVAASFTLPAEEPLDTLRANVDSVIEIIYDTDTNLATKQDRLVAVAERQFSFPTIARRALGRDWNQLDAAQQQRFIELFKDLLLFTYTSGLETRRPEDRPKVVWAGQRELRAGLMEVSSTVHLDGAAYPALYRLARLEEGWRVYDLIIEGTSMVSNYRQQFTSLLRNGTIDDLFATLEQRIEENRNSPSD